MAGCCASRARSTSTCSCWPTRLRRKAAATSRPTDSSKDSFVPSVRPRRRRRDSSMPSSSLDRRPRLVASATGSSSTRSGRPILIGPWLSEAGFELLYWIPFLAWAKAYGNLDPSQLVVISRGGAASWYRDITTNYEDVLSFYSPDEFRARNDARIVEQRGRLKHVETSTFDPTTIP